MQRVGSASSCEGEEQTHKRQDKPGGPVEPPSPRDLRISQSPISTTRRKLVAARYNARKGPTKVRLGSGQTWFNPPPRGFDKEPQDMRDTTLPEGSRGRRNFHEEDVKSNRERNPENNRVNQTPTRMGQAAKSIQPSGDGDREQVRALSHEGRVLMNQLAAFSYQTEDAIARS